MPEFVVPKVVRVGDHIGMVFQTADGKSARLQFLSPEHILQFMNVLMEEAVKVWPDDQWIKEYLSEENSSN